MKISSFTDYIGSTEYNQKLSQQRANEVLKYLTEKGIDKNRMIAVGLGESTPKVITIQNYRYLIPIKYQNDFPIGSVLDEKFIQSLKSSELKEAALQINRRMEFEVVCTEWSAGKPADYCLKK